MSSESHTTSETGTLPAPTLPQELPCTFCEGRATLALQTYPEDDGPDGVGPNGGLHLCGDCAGEAIELLGAWDAHEQPAIDAETAICGGYRAVAADCSFCTEQLGDGPLTGVELYDTPDDGLPEYANYTLCPDCQAVFGEFLINLEVSCR